MKKIFFVAVLVVFSIIFIYGSRSIYRAFRQGAEEKVSASTVKKEDLARKKAAWELLKKSIGNELKGFNGTVGVVVKDLDTGWEIVFNGDASIPSASMVKIPIMMAYFYASEEGDVDLRSKVRITEELKSPGSGLLKNSPEGGEFSIEELINLMITRSDNTAANILIDRIGFDGLNNYFSRLGLKHTNLSRKMMDFRLRKKGVENYTTARDMAYLLDIMYNDRFLSPAISKKCLQILSGQKVNDRIPKKLPGGTVTAHKTGLENGLCHDAGIVYTDKGNFLICVLVKHHYKGAVPAKGLIATISLLTYKYCSSN